MYIEFESVLISRTCLFFYIYIYRSFYAYLCTSCTKVSRYILYLWQYVLMQIRFPSYLQHMKYKWIDGYNYIIAGIVYNWNISNRCRSFSTFPFLFCVYTVRKAKRKVPVIKRYRLGFSVHGCKNEKILEILTFSVNKKSLLNTAVKERWLFIFGQCIIVLSPLYRLPTSLAIRLLTYFHYLLHSSIRLLLYFFTDSQFHCFIYFHLLFSFSLLCAMCYSFHPLCASIVHLLTHVPTFTFAIVLGSTLPSIC
jgi:hypothetical protein